MCFDWFRLWGIALQCMSCSLTGNSLLLPYNMSGQHICDMLMLSVGYVTAGF